MCNGVSNAGTPQYNTNMPILPGGPGDSSVGGASGGGAPGKTGVGGAYGPPQKTGVGGAYGPPMKTIGQVGQVGQGLPVQGGGPADGAALISNTQMQSVLQSLVQALTALTSLIAARNGAALPATASASGGGATAPVSASAGTAPAASTLPAGTTSVPAASTTTV